MNKSYGTLSETINGLKKEGYSLDFNIRQEYLICDETNAVLSPDDFKIDKVYSNPDDITPGVFLNELFKTKK